MTKYLDDILIFLGGLLIVAGCYLVWPVAALFAGGILLIIFGVLIGAGNRLPDERKSR